MPRVIDLDTALTDDTPRRYRTIAVDPYEFELVAHCYTDRLPTPRQIKDMLTGAGVDLDDLTLRVDKARTSVLRYFGQLQFRTRPWMDVTGMIERFHRELAEAEAVARASCPCPETSPDEARRAGRPCHELSGAKAATPPLSVDTGRRADKVDARALARPGDLIVSPFRPKYGTRSGADRD